MPSDTYFDYPVPSRTFQRQSVTPKRGRTLIVGSYVTEGKTDRRKAFKDAIGIDMRDGPGVDRVLNLEEPLPKDVGFFDHIECMSVLEHSRRPWLLAANLERMLFDGGTIFITVPFVWRVHSYPDDYWRMTVPGIKALFENIHWIDAAYAHLTVDHKGKIPSVYQDGKRYLTYTESCAFGVRK